MMLRMEAIIKASIYRLMNAEDETNDKGHYYSTIMSFYHIRSRESAKYEAVIHCSVLV